MKVEPRRVLIELTARCNFDCRYCPRGLLPKYRLKDMEFKTFKYIIDNLPKSVKWVHPQGYGEPFMYPYFFSVLRYIKNSGRKIKFYTNGSLIERGMATELGKIGVDQIVFSVDDVRPDKVQDSRPDVSLKLFERIIDTLVVLNKYPKVKTITRICKTKDNKDRMTEIQLFWSKYADVVAVSPEIETFKPHHVGNLEWVMGKKQWRTKPCENIMTQIMIRSDGSIGLCCNDWLNFYPVTHIKDLEDGLTFTDIMNNDKFKMVRKQLRSGRELPQICAQTRCSRF